MNQFHLYKTVSMFREFCIHQCQRMWCSLAVHSCESDKMVTLCGEHKKKWFCGIQDATQFLATTVFFFFSFLHFAWKVEWVECVWLLFVLNDLISRNREKNNTQMKSSTYNFNSPSSTVTIKASWCINAYVITASVCNFTFVHRTLVFWFILTRWTVYSSITYFTIWYAHSAAAIKFSRSVASSYRRS